MLLKRLSFTTLIFLPLFALSQINIKGKVFDIVNNEPLSGAEIAWSENGYTTITDTSGYFELVLPEASQLHVNYLGYESKSFLVSSNTKFLNIGLKGTGVQLNEIIVSAGQENEPLLKTTGAVSLITTQELQRDNQVTISTTLNRVPGVYMHSGALNTNRITMRGIGARSPFSTTKIRAYLNEIPLTTGEGETTIEDIDLGIIDQIEVIKGPAATIYGAGLGGTINLKTQKAPYKTTSLRSHASLGAYGLFRTVNGFKHSTDKVNISSAITTIDSDGYRENNSYNRKTATVLAQIYPNTKNWITFFGNVTRLKAFIPSSIDSTTFAENPRAAAFTWKQSQGFEDYDKGLFGISHKGDLSDNLYISSSVFTNFRDAYELRPFNILSENTSALGGRTKMTYNPQLGNGKSKVHIGAEYFMEWYSWETYENDDRIPGDLLSDNKEKRTYYNIFSQFDVALTDNTNLILGINVNHTQYDFEDVLITDHLDQSGNYSFKTQWSPRIAVNHRLHEKVAIHANISHGFSPPKLSETLTPDGVINPMIQPETGYNFELGSRGTLLSDRLFFDISIYTMRIKNLLVARRVGDDQFVGVNAGKTRHNGLELALGYDLIKAKSNELSPLRFFANYTYADYKFKAFLDGEDDFSGNDLTGTPANKLNIGLDFNARMGLYGNVNVITVSKMPLRDDNSIYSKPYSLLNFKTGFKHNLSKQFAIDFYLGINNLWNEKYASMVLINASSFDGRAPRYFYPGLPINLYTGLSLNYNLTK